MARINIEETWWNDPRRERLSEYLGNPNLTEGVSVRLWRLSQTYWKKGLLIPGDVFIHLHGAHELLKSGLARVYDTPKTWLYPDKCERYPNGPERPPNDVERELNDCRTRWASVRDISALASYFIYAHGSREHHFWMIQGHLQRVEAGKRSAQVRKLRTGSAQPTLKTLKNPERNLLPFDARPNEPRTDPNGPEPSYSSSVSNSCSNEDPEFKNIGPSEFERIYTLYPKRYGTQRKADGIRTCESKLKTPEQVRDFEKAVTNYAKHIRANEKEGTEFVSQFKTFTGNVWKEWVNPDQKLLEAPVKGNGMHPVTKAQAISQKNDDTFRAYLEKKGIGKAPTDEPMGN